MAPPTGAQEQGSAGRPRPRRTWSAWRPLRSLSSKTDAVRGFTPSWFTVVMSTGIVAQLLATFPYDAPAKNEVGWAFWWLTVVLFALCSAMFASRFIFYWRDALLLFQHPVQAAFLGAIPPALSGIINGFTLFLAPRWDRGRVLDAAVVLWWVNASLSLAMTTLLPFFFFRMHSNPLSSMTAVWLMPVIPAIVCAGSGGLLAREAPLHAADSIIDMSYILWGVGVPLSFSIMTIYYRRLSQHNLPPAELVVSSFLPVGPMGMGALALLNLGAAMVRLYPPGQAAAAASAALSGTDDAALQQVYSSYVATVALSVGGVLALIMWAFGLWWLVVAWCSVAASWRRMRFSVGWWGFVFPLGVFSSAANTLWRQVPGLAAFRVIAAVLIVCVVLLMCMCMAYTLVLGWRGTLFDSPCLRMSKAMRGAAAGAGAATNVGLPAGSCAVVGREAAPLDAAERAALQQLHNAVQGLQGPGPPVKLDP